ncbi:MAG: hypothetical protein AAF355_06660 [Myxococcota bacterium]
MEQATLREVVQEHPDHRNSVWTQVLTPVCSAHIRKEDRRFLWAGVPVK